MNKELILVKEFHRAAFFPIAESPSELSEERLSLRYRLLRDQIEELLAAERVEKQADCFIDIIYYAFGGLVEAGVEPDGLFQAEEIKRQKERV